MAKFPGSSEITESIECPASKMNEGGQKHHNLEPIKRYCIEDDINKLFEAIEIRNSSRGVRKSEKGVKDVMSKRAMKRPMRSSPSRPSGIGISEPVSLKQALRGLCISQASELAAVKKQLSKASRLSTVSETGAVKRLYSTVIVEANDPEHRDDGGIQNLVEISLVPERSIVAFHRIPDFENVPVQELGTFEDTLKHKASNIEAESDALYQSTYGYEYSKEVSGQRTTLELPLPSTGNCTDKEELVLNQMVPSVNEAPAVAIVADKEDKQDLNFVSCSSFFGAGNKVINPTSNSPSLMKPRSKTFFRKKVLSSFTSRSKYSNGGIDSDLSCSTNELPCQTPECALRNNQKEEDKESPDSCGPSSLEVSSSSVKSGFTKLGLSSNNCNKARSILTQADERSRSKEKAQMSQSSKSSIGDYSSTTSLSDESYVSGSSRSGYRPRMSKDLRWEAIVCVQKQHGNIGLRHFKLLRKLGGGDIGNVYLSELMGTNCLFAVKVMDNDLLTNKRKMTRAQTEIEILQILDHPFLPTLFAHFTNDKYSCLVMEYCPGGDLHLLRQKQPNKSFSEQAASSPSENSSWFSDHCSGGFPMPGGQKSYSVNPNDYKLLEEVGYGASATVYRTIYTPSNEVVAVKCLDLDRCNSNLDDIRREAQTMSLIGHPNLIKAFCSFVVDHYLWVVMPFMAEGSCLHLMKIAYPDGFEEAVIGSILKETLKALEYLHQHGHIHRDVKAGNILLDTNGVVKLADFGVSACMFDSGDRQRSRNTFTGTPCWMAPEVLQPGTGYDFKADIWSFGITALELAHGHAPFSKYPPMKVLLMTINSAPPGLDYDRDKKFSKSFKEMVAMCLVKDQTKRPTAEKLLKHTFFKKVKPPELSIKKLFADLPSLGSRVKILQLKDAAQLASKKMPSSEQEAISQSEYQRGVSAWNFDLEDLKLQASMVQDDDEILEIREEDESIKSNMNYKENSVSALNAGRSSLKQDIISSEQGSVVEVTLAECQRKKGEDSECNKLDSDHQEEGGLKKNSSKTELPPLISDKDAVQAKSKCQTTKACRSQSGPLMPGVELSHSASERAGNFERSKIESQQAEKGHQVRRAPSFSGPLMLPNRASANSKSAPINSSGGFKESSDDKSTANLVQIKGRFSVTSENVDLVKGSQLRKTASVGDWILESKLMPPSRIPKELGLDNIPASVLMPHLQNLLQQTSIQQDLIVNLLNSLQLSEAGDAPQHGKSYPQCVPENNGSVDGAVSERERMLLLKIYELQARMSSLTDELTTEKLKYMQLQQRLNAMSNQGEDWDRRESES